MTNKKQNLREDLAQIDYLMGYDRSKTIFEQAEGTQPKTNKRLAKKRPLNEVAWVPAIAAVLGASEVVDWVGDWWNDEGAMGGDEKYALAMDRGTWGEIEKAIRKLEIETGVPVLDDMGVISRSQADEYADELYEAMDGWGTTDPTELFEEYNYEFGKKDGETLEEWIDGDLSSADVNRYWKQPLAGKPFMVFKNVNYSTGAEFLAAIQADIEGDTACEDGMVKDKDGKCVKPEGGAFNESFACVVETSKKHGGTLKKSKSGLEYYQIRIGNDVGLFTVDGRVVFYPGGKKANRKPATGFASYVCQGDELSLGDTGEELSLDEGLKRALKKKSNLSEEEFNFGGMYFEVGGPDTPEKEKVKPPSGGGTDNKQRYTKGPSFEQVVSGSRTMHRGHSGPGVKKLQELLPGAKLKLDGIFGPATESAVISFQKSNNTGQEAGGEVMAMTAKTLLKGGQGGSEEVVTTTVQRSCTAAQKANGMVAIPGGGCGCPNGTTPDANGKCVTDQEYPENETVAVMVNTTDNKGDVIKVGDQLVFDSENGVDVLKSPNGSTFETTDDVEVTKFNKRTGNFKKIVTNTQKITFDKYGNVKKVKDRRGGFLGLGKRKNK